MVVLGTDIPVRLPRFFRGRTLGDSHELRFYKYFAALPLDMQAVKINDCTG